jgi:hypothetical protein
MVAMNSPEIAPSDLVKDCDMILNEWSEKTEGNIPNSIDFQDAVTRSGDRFLSTHVQQWITLSQHASMAGHALVLEDGPEILDPEQAEEEHGEEPTGMYAPVCDSSTKHELEG